MLVRILFALLALGAVYGLVSGPPGGVPESEPWLRRLLLIAIMTLCLGMVVPWGRWLRCVSPGQSLGFAAKFLGWFGACTLPFYMAAKAWNGALVLAILLILSVALWRGHLWAVWIWYLAALGSLATASVCLVDIVTGDDSVLKHWYAIQDHVLNLVGLLGSVIGLTLLREINALRRRLSSAGSASSAPPAY